MQILHSGIHARIMTGVLKAATVPTRFNCQDHFSNRRMAKVLMKAHRALYTIANLGRAWLRNPGLEPGLVMEVGTVVSSMTATSSSNKVTGGDGIG